MSMTIVSVAGFFLTLFIFSLFIRSAIRYGDLRAAIKEFLDADGHDLCHVNRVKLTDAAGLDPNYPKLPKDEKEFAERCETYRKELYSSGNAFPEVCLFHPGYAFDNSPATTSQPPPTPAGNSEDIWTLVRRDMQQRSLIGYQKYRQPVHAFNGRDALIDAYQECLDQSVYLRQEMERRRVLRSYGVRVAVIGPLTCDGPEWEQQNLEAAMRAAHDLFQSGFEPWLPHLGLLWEKTIGFKAGWERWMRISLCYISTCEAVLRLPSKRGNKGGTETEEKFAQSLGIPVFHSALDLLTTFQHRLEESKRERRPIPHPSRPAEPDHRGTGAPAKPVQ